MRRGGEHPVLVSQPQTAAGALGVQRLFVLRGLIVCLVLAFFYEVFFCSLFGWGPAMANVMVRLLDLRASRTAKPVLSCVYW